LSAHVCKRKNSRPKKAEQIRCWPGASHPLIIRSWGILPQISQSTDFAFFLRLTTHQKGGEVRPLGAKGSDGPLIQIMRAHIDSPPKVYRFDVSSGIRARLQVRPDRRSTAAQSPMTHPMNTHSTAPAGCGNSIQPRPFISSSDHMIYALPLSMTLGAKIPWCPCHWRAGIHGTACLLRFVDLDQAKRYCEPHQRLAYDQSGHAQ
jgi:hypothetical protein